MWESTRSSEWGAGVLTVPLRMQDKTIASYTGHTSAQILLKVSLHNILDIALLRHFYKICWATFVLEPYVIYWMSWSQSSVPHISDCWDWSHVQILFNSIIQFNSFHLLIVLKFSQVWLPRIPEDVRSGPDDHCKPFLGVSGQVYSQAVPGCTGWLLWKSWYNKKGDYIKGWSDVSTHTSPLGCV